MSEVAGKDQESSLNAIEPSTYRVRLIARREVAQRTMALFFERPAGFSFKAGQFIDLMLLDPTETDSEGNTRAFTIHRQRAVRGASPDRDPIAGYRL